MKAALHNNKVTFTDSDGQYRTRELTAEERAIIDASPSEAVKEADACRPCVRPSKQSSDHPSQDAKSSMQKIAENARNRVTYWKERHDIELEIRLDADALLREALDLLGRYRKETPLGNQPHMIAHVVDKHIKVVHAYLATKGRT